MRRLFAVLMLNLLLVSGAVWATGVRAGSPAVEQALERALAADATQTYRGTMLLFTWATGTGEATVVTVNHRAPGQSRLEYLNPRREPYLVVVDDGVHHWEYHPGGRTASVEASPEIPEVGSGSLDLLRHNYNLQDGGQGDLAGRATDIVELVARGCRLPNQRLWIDRQTGVVLRTEQYRADGSLSSLSVFTSFEPVKSLPDDLFRLRVPEGVRVRSDFGPAAPLRDLSATSGIAVRLPAGLPTGFVYAGATISQEDEGRIVHLRFTDGLGVISLFEREARPFARYRLSGSKPVELKAGRGWLSEECGSYVLNWTSGGINFTLIGELPAETLTRLANSVPPGPSLNLVAYLRMLFSRFDD